MDEGISLIMVDDMDWNTLLGPQYVVGIGNELVPVYIGHYINSGNNSVEDEARIIGIWVKSTDYHKIDHSLMYLFIHDYEIEPEELEKIVENINNNGESMAVEDPNATSREHYHIGINIEDQLEGFSNSYIH